MVDVVNQPGADPYLNSWLVPGFSKEGIMTLDPAIIKKQTEQMTVGKGFIAALDQSGGSTPKALRNYGINDDQYSNETEMFDLIHQMRTRIMTSSAFNSEKVIGAILFEQTMDRDVEGKPTCDYLWEEKGVVPFLKVDKGLANEANGVQLMKPMPELDTTLARAVEKNVFGTKMRSLIKQANAAGVKEIVAQQFAVAKKIAEYGLVPIIEPEVDINCPDKAEAEELLLAAIMDELKSWPDKPVMFKLTIPTVVGFYSDLMTQPNVIRVVALSGGYSREDANAKMAQNPGLIASFSRALTEGLTAQMTDDEFDSGLADAIGSIYEASIS